MNIGIGLYGFNGHQIRELFPCGGLGQVVAVAGVSPEAVPEPFRGNGTVAVHPSLDKMLDDPRVQLVSLCSPRRREQAAHAVRALRAGKHVHAEKPCAMNEADLDAILAAARISDRMFHEMAGTAFVQPYFAMRQVVLSGVLGGIVQVTCEKSYPYHEDRPQDEEIDGGLIGQSAVHGVRMVEQVAGVRVRSVTALESRFGNPVAGGGLRMAASLAMRLENGGLASVCANYLNPTGTGIWGDESLRIFGTRGKVESIHGGRETRLVVGSEDRGPLDTSKPGVDFLGAFLGVIAGHGEMPLSIEEELSPTRWVIRAKQAAEEESALR